MPHMWPRQRFTCNRSQPLRWTSHRGTWWWRRYFQSIPPCQRQNIELRPILSEARSPRCRLKLPQLPVAGILVLEGPHQPPREAHAGDREQEGKAAALRDHLTWMLSVIHTEANHNLTGKKCRVKWCNTSRDPPTSLWRPSRNTKRVWSKYDSLWWMFMYIHV